MATQSTSIDKPKPKAKPRRKPAAKTSARTRTAAAPQPRKTAEARRNGGRDAVLDVLATQQKTTAAVLEYQTRVARLSPVPGTTTLVDAQARLVRRASDAYVTVVRDLLK